MSYTARLVVVVLVSVFGLSCEPAAVSPRQKDSFSKQRQHSSVVIESVKLPSGSQLVYVKLHDNSRCVVYESDHAGGVDCKFTYSVRGD